MPERQAKSSRRGFLWGAAAAGAATTAAAVLPAAPQAPTPLPADEPQPAPDKGGGYRVTEHVERYYRSTRL